MKNTPNFKDISNTIASSTCSKQPKYIFRRKSEIELQPKKRPLTSNQLDSSIVCFIPMSKIQRSPSEVLQGPITSLHLSKQSSVDKLNKTVNQEGSCLRFARKTDKISSRPVTKNQEKDNTCCQMKSCVEERSRMNDKMKTYLAMNHHLTKQNERLSNLIDNINSKVTSLAEDLSQKTIQIEQLNKHLQYRQVGSYQMEEALKGKDRMIFRLQETIKALEKQRFIATSRIKPEEAADCASLIHELTQKLKYKQIESHIFKKEKQALRNLQREHKAALKENSTLRERLSYYMRLTGQQKAPLKESASSLSLSITSATSDRFNFGWINVRQGQKTDRESPITQSSL